MQHDGKAQAALFRHTFHVQRERLEARPQRLHEEQVLLLRESEQIAQLRGVRRRRLLAQDVLAVQQGIAGVLVVERVWCTCVARQQNPWAAGP